LRRALAPFNADFDVFGWRQLTLVNCHALMHSALAESGFRVEDKEFSLDRSWNPEVSISLPRPMHFAMVRFRPASTISSSNKN
jgi:hypothetical protein